MREDDGTPTAAGMAAEAAGQGQQAAAQREARVGVLYGLAAYGWWGFVPIYFKAVAHVPAAEVLAHRIAWSVVLLALLVRLRGRSRTVIETLKNGSLLRLLVLSTCLLALNWFTFIWAVAHDQVLEASLGYFINPLVSMVLGFLFLGERLRPLQLVSVSLAVVGVSLLTLRVGSLPWVAATLALSFGFYGLLRKKASVGGVAGLMVEVLLLAPMAVAYLVYLATQGGGFFRPETAGSALLLVVGGVVTSTPLVWFAEATRRLRLVTVGFLQYLAPSLQLLLAVGVFGEAFTRHHALSFGCIWTALALYSLDTARSRRKSPR